MSGKPEVERGQTKAGKWDSVGRARVPYPEPPTQYPNGEGTSGLNSRFPYRKCHKVAGAAYRTRTCDPRITNAMLYQLS